MNIRKEIGKLILITSMASLEDVIIKATYDKIWINDYCEQAQYLEDKLIENYIDKLHLNELGELNNIIERKKDEMLYEMILGASMLCTSAIGAGLILVKKNRLNKIYEEDQELVGSHRNKVLVIGTQTDLSILDKVLGGTLSTTDLKKKTNDKMEIKSLENVLTAVREIWPVEYHYCDHKKNEIWGKYFNGENEKPPYSMIISVGYIRGYYSEISGLPEARDISKKVQSFANKWNIPLYPIDAPRHYFKELFNYLNSIWGGSEYNNIFVPPVEI